MHDSWDVCFAAKLASPKCRAQDRFARPAIRYFEDSPGRNDQKPQIHVFDTYATCSDGRIMHFDVILPEKDAGKALSYAREWLTEIGEADAALGQERCCYCHSEAQAPAEMENEFAKRGYAIYRMEGCPRG